MDGHGAAVGGAIVDSGKFDWMAHADKFPGLCTPDDSYHGITYADEAVLPEDKGQMTVRFWNPIMKNGVISFIRPEECTIKRHVREMEIKPFGEEHGNFQGLSEFLGGDGVAVDE